MNLFTYTIQVRNIGSPEDHWQDTQKKATCEQDAQILVDHFTREHARIFTTPRVEYRYRAGAPSPVKGEPTEEGYAAMARAIRANLGAKRMNRLSTSDAGYCEDCAQALSPVEIDRGDTICGQCRADIAEAHDECLPLEDAE